MSPHLKLLENEAITLIREVCYTNDFDKIVVFYSIGKDSSVLLRLFEKAFAPFPIPVRFMHIDTGWKFKEMYDFKQEVAKKISLITYKNPLNLNPYTDGRRYTDEMKTQALKQALNQYGFKVAFGGSRRDEEKSRAKERMISVRNAYHKWDPRNQNPEIPPLYNTLYSENNSLRVFPLSNWTELDIWEYIKAENIPIVPIYFAHKRRVVQIESGMLLATETDEGNYKQVRFRTLGCFPLTGAIESKAQTIDDIINELKFSEYTERITRVIDHDTEGSMEKKKKDGYF